MWRKVLTLCYLLAGVTAFNISHNHHHHQYRVQTDEIDGFVPLNGQRFDHFDWKLCSNLARAETGNVIISPISIKLLLKMLYEGSTGASSEELLRALNLPRDKTASRLESSAIVRSLQMSSANYKMEIGSKMFITENITPKNWYQRILYIYYNAYIEKLDFSDSTSATKRINNWVRHVTHDQIKNFLTSDNGFESTVMMLINAIYFKGTWVIPFPKGDSHPGKFHTPNGIKDVSFMTQTNNFYYSRSEKLGAQILRLPYMGQKFSMYVILPERKDGLDDLIQSINPAELRRHIWLLEETWLEVILPKFKFEYKAELKDTLRQLGIRKIFESYNDMKGLSKNEKVKDIVVSNVIQKAAIDVNEDGSVAAAATEFQLINKFGGGDELFNASHPFLFFIEDETTGTIVFVGKMMEPSGYEPVPASPSPQGQPEKAYHRRTHQTGSALQSNKNPRPGNNINNNNNSK